jgi:hypothetical protein
VKDIIEEIQKVLPDMGKDLVTLYKSIPFNDALEYLSHQIANNLSDREMFSIFAKAANPNLRMFTEAEFIDRLLDIVTLPDEQFKDGLSDLIDEAENVEDFKEHLQPFRKQLIEIKEESISGKRK